MKLNTEQLNALLKFTSSLTAALVLAETENDFEEACERCGINRDIAWFLADDAGDPLGKIRSNPILHSSPATDVWEEKLLEAVIPGRVSASDEERSKQIGRLRDCLTNIPEYCLYQAVYEKFSGGNQKPKSRFSGDGYSKNEPHAKLNSDKRFSIGIDFLRDELRCWYIATGEDKRLNRIYNPDEIQILKSQNIFTESDMPKLSDDDILRIANTIPNGKVAFISTLYTHQKLLFD